MPVVIRKPDGSSLRLDAVVAVSFRPRAVASEHPTEDPTVDSVKRLADVVHLQGVVSRSAWSYLPDADVRDRHVRAAEFLESCLGQIVTIEGTERGDFDRMAILSVDHASEGRAGFTFDLDARQIRLATLTTTRIPLASVDRSRAGGAPTARNAEDFADAEDVGEQGTTTPDPAQASTDRSLLSSGLSWLGIGG